jgi:hypothetical protein
MGLPDVLKTEGLGEHGRHRVDSGRKEERVVHAATSLFAMIARVDALSSRVSTSNGVDHDVAFFAACTHSSRMRSVSAPGLSRRISATTCRASASLPRA